MRFLWIILSLDAVASIGEASPINEVGQKLSGISTSDSDGVVTGDLDPPIKSVGFRRGENSSLSYEVEEYKKGTSNNVVVPPQREYFDQTRMSVRLATAVVGFTYAGYSLWTLETSCKGYVNDGGFTNGAQCVVGSLTTAAGLVLQGERFANACITLAKDLATATQVNLAQGFQDYVMNFGLGPFLARAGRGQLGAREWKRELIVKRAEDEISSLLGLEVRHIGIWDGTLPGQSAKRDNDAEIYPIFGFNAHGNDFHFAYMGNDPMSNATRFKLGHGPGPATVENSRRLKGRNTVIYNKYYFDSGGLDAIGESDIVGDSTNELDPSNSKDTDWLYQQFVCYLGVKTSSHPSQMDAYGLWWQAYDDSASGTLAAGAIAPFSANKRSIITWMKIESGLEVNKDCVKHDEL